MASAVVQFRASEEQVAWLRDAGLKPNDFAREAFERALKRERVAAAFAELRRIPMRRTMRAEDIIRAERESH